jgi:hypothetical protein
MLVLSCFQIFQKGHEDIKKSIIMQGEEVAISRVKIKKVVSKGAW